MKNLTRRNFLETAGQAALAGTAIIRADFLYGRAPDQARDSHPGGGEFGHARLPLSSLIFPEPKNITSSGSDFLLGDQVPIIVPSNSSQQDELLANLLQHELSDRFSVFPKTGRTSALSGNRPTILMGSIRNPLVRQYCGQVGLLGRIESLAAEGYLLRADENAVLVAGKDDRGAFYGLQSLRQLLESDGNETWVRGAEIRDWPDKPFRGIYLFLPGRNNIPFFKRFVANFMALHKFNTVIVEMNGCMRLDRHPELNSGSVKFARDVNYAARNYPLGPVHDMEQNSSHQDVADGEVLEKEEVAELAEWARWHHLDFVPEVPSFTHSYFLLTEHRDLAAVPENKWPDIYCPSNPKSYGLVFEVYDEYIDTLKPASIHIGHDELFLPINVSRRCEDKDISELYGEDVKKIHDHLDSRGVKTQLWGDMLLQSVRGTGPRKHVTSDGWTYKSPGGLTREQVERLIPKNCLIYNWFWSDEPGNPNKAELNEGYLEEMGFQQIFGNLDNNIKDFETRKKRQTLLGGAPSAWAATHETGFGKDLMAVFLGCSRMLWTGQTMPPKDLSGRVQSLIPAIRSRLSGVTPPSLTEASSSIVPVDISNAFNLGGAVPELGVDLEKIASGTVHFNNVPFNLKAGSANRAIVAGTVGKDDPGLPREVKGIGVSEAPLSLIFLHASARPALNRESFRLIWDQQDTADLLGFYEIVYEDGFVSTIPVRYGVNILESNWEQRTSANDYCYDADAVAIGQPEKASFTAFAYEWINPRIGKTVREVRVKGTNGFHGGSLDYNNDLGPVIDSNAVILIALSLVKERR